MCHPKQQTGSPGNGAESSRAALPPCPWELSTDPGSVAQVPSLCPLPLSHLFLLSTAFPSTLRASLASVAG